MLAAVMEWLAVDPAGTYVDCTAGGGGHAMEIAARLTTGRLLAFDRDPAAVAMAGERLKPFPHATVEHANYGALKDVLETKGIDGVNGVLIDAGCSSMQIDAPQRGFSFQADGPLDMRMDTTSPIAAAHFLRDTPSDELAAVLRAHGDVGPAKRIAKAIADRVSMGRMETTGDLAEAVRSALDFVRGEPAEIRTVFQAIRMAVNDELGGLERGLNAAIDALLPDGRVVVLTFHSGEDRVAKQALRDAGRKRREFAPDGRVKAVHPPRVRVLTPSPVEPDATEVQINPRAKSAKLRAATRI